MRRRIAEWLVRAPRGRLLQAASAVCAEDCFAALVPPLPGPFPRCTLSFDCDFPRDVEVLPQVVALLARYGFAASFACVGQWVRRFPEAHRALVHGGHELLNHTYTHPNLYHPGYAYARHEDLSRVRFDAMAPGERRSEVMRCHETCVDVLDFAPIGFRTPHFGAMRVPEVYSLLAELGYRFSTSVLAAGSDSQGLPYRHPDGVWEIPLSPCPAHPLGVFDSWHAIGKRSAAHGGPGELSALFARLCDQVVAVGGYANVYLDPKDAMDSGELERMLTVLKGHDLRVVTYQDLLGELEPQESGCRVGAP